MRPRTPFPKGAKKELMRLLSKAENIGQRRKVQACLLRAQYEWPAEKIAEETGLSTSRVYHIHAAYLKEGASALVGKAWGGRVRNPMTLAQEKAFLQAFEGVATEGRLALIDELKAAFEKQTQRQVSRLSIYRLLHRHGWRKVKPRTAHPKADPKAAKAFKKNSNPWFWKPPEKPTASPCD